MTSVTKRRAIVFLILAALVTMLLAVTLPQLELQQGIPLPGGNSQTEAAPQEAVEPTPSINRNTFIESIIGLFVLMVFIYLVVKRRQRLNRKEVVQILMRLAALSLFLTFLLYTFSNVKIDTAPTAVEILPEEIAIVVEGPPLAPVPSSLLWLGWILLAGLVLLLVIMITRVQIQHKVKRDSLALEAEQAIEAIKAGQDLSNVIIRCYQQMSLVLKKEHGLTLEKTMTAREFEALLEKRGVPNPPVRQLTQLFEIARYAAQAPGPAEEVQAIDCLNRIAQYSLNKEPDRPK